MSKRCLAWRMAGDTALAVPLLSNLVLCMCPVATHMYVNSYTTERTENKGFTHAPLRMARVAPWKARMPPPEGRPEAAS